MVKYCNSVLQNLRKIIWVLCLVRLSDVLQRFHVIHRKEVIHHRVLPQTDTSLSPGVANVFNQ